MGPTVIEMPRTVTGDNGFPAALQISAGGDPVDVGTDFELLITADTPFEFRVGAQDGVSPGSYRLTIDTIADSAGAEQEDLPVSGVGWIWVFNGPVRMGMI